MKSISLKGKKESGRENSYNEKDEEKIKKAEKRGTERGMLKHEVVFKRGNDTRGHFEKKMKVPLKRVMDTESQNEGKNLNSVQKWKLSCESLVKKKKKTDEKSKEERI